MRFSKPNIDLNEADRRVIDNIFRTVWVSIGCNMKVVEAHFMDMCNVKHAIACGSCTQGLLIAMQAVGWKGKHVAVPSFTWPSTIYAIETSGNYPVFCDINKDTWLIDLETAQGKYDEIVPVDTFGNECQEYEDAIYDSAHGYGLNGLGSRGVAEVVSFSHTKPVTACEGGIILVNNDNVADKARELRRLTSRMGEVNAAVAIASIRQYKEYFAERRGAIREYMTRLTFDYDVQTFSSDTNLSVFAILLKSKDKRDAIIEAFKRDGIEVKAYYEPIVKGLPVTDDIYSRILALPTYRDVDINRVIGVANKA